MKKKDKKQQIEKKQKETRIYFFVKLFEATNTHLPVFEIEYRVTFQSHTVHTKGGGTVQKTCTQSS